MEKLNYSRAVDKANASGAVICVKVEEKTAKNNQIYYALQLTEGKRQFGGKWFQPKFKPTENLIYVLDGHWDQYQQSPIEFKVENMTETTELSAEDFMYGLGKKVIQENKEKILSLIESITDKEYTAIVDALFDLPFKSQFGNTLGEAFFYFPGAKGHHHAYIGGLAEHTLEVACCGLSTVKYRGYNRDLYVAGSIVHDIGKIFDYTVLQNGLIGYSERINYGSHISTNSRLIGRIEEKGNLNLEKLDNIWHMMVSHHGIPEWGSYDSPKFSEARLLHDEDNKSAKLSPMDRFIADAKDGGKTQTDYDGVAKTTYIVLP